MDAYKILTFIVFLCIIYKKKFGKTILMIDEKKVSIIMSTCDAKEEHLVEAVNSILTQTYKNIELIVIIDGGKYNGCLSGYNDDRLHIIKHQKSLGLAARLNEGLSLAKGEYVARMDSDDYSLPERLSVQVRFMEEHPDVDICSTFARQFGGGNKVLVNPYTENDYICAQLFIGNAIIHPTVMFRMESIKKFDIKYDQKFRYSQDYDLWVTLSDKAVFAIIPKIELLYRIHGHQVSSKKKEIQEKYFRKTVSTNIVRLGLPNTDIQFIEFLHGRNKTIDYAEMSSFIEKCLLRNDDVCMYDRKAFKRVLFRRVFVALLKQRKFFLSVKYFRLHVFNYLFRKLLLQAKCKIQYNVNKIWELEKRIC